MKTSTLLLIGAAAGGAFLLMRKQEPKKVATYKVPGTNLELSLEGMGYFHSGLGEHKCGNCQRGLPCA